LLRAHRLLGELQLEILADLRLDLGPRLQT